MTAASTANQSARKKQPTDTKADLDAVRMEKLRQMLIARQEH